MNKIKNIVIMSLVVVGFLFAANVSAKEKVKVYVFEAVGCPACDQQVSVLKQLSETNSNFDTVVKELYKSNQTWEQGSEYELGVKVVNAFFEKGYVNAAYNSTPMVVIGTKYASTGAVTDLEILDSLINTAFEEEQEDVVACFEKGGTDCEKKIFDRSDEIKQAEQDAKDTDKVTRTFLAIVVLAGAGWFLYKVTDKKKD